MNSERHETTIALVLLITSYYQFLNAVDVLHTFTGAEAADWATGSNWDLGTSPNANNHTVTFTNTNDPANNGTVTVKSLINALDASTNARQILNGGTLTFDADTGNASIIQNDNNQFQIYNNVDIQSDLDVNLNAGAVFFGKALTGDNTKTINIYGPTSGSDSLTLKPQFNLNNNTFTGTIRVNDRGRLQLGDATTTTTPTVQATGLTIKMATTNAFNNILIFDKTQTTYDFQLDLIDNDTTKVIFAIDSIAGAGGAYTYSGSIYSRNAGDTANASVDRSISFRTYGKTLRLNGDNSNLTFSNSGKVMQFESNGASDATFYIDSDNALGSSNSNKIQFNDTTSGTNFYVLNNRTVQSVIVLQGANDAEDILIGGSDSGSASGSTSFTGQIKLNNDSDATNTRNLQLWSNNTENVTFSGIISDTLASNYFDISKTGTGTVTLTAANTYGGSTTVSAGSLVLNNSSGSGTGTGNISVSAGATLSGTGSISGAVTSLAGSIDAGDGANAVGSFGIGNGTSSNLDNGTYIWNMGNASGSTAGTDYDQLQFTSSNFDISGLSSTPLTIRIRNKTAGFYQSLEGLSSFTNSTNYGNASAGDYEIMTGVTGIADGILDDTYFQLDSDILNINWELKKVGNSLWLSYAAVPEPSTWLMIVLSSLLIAYRLGRKVLLKSRE